MRVRTLVMSALTACCLTAAPLAVAQPPEEGAQQEERREGRAERREGRAEGREGRAEGRRGRGEGPREGRPGGFGQRGPGQAQGGPPAFRPGQILPPRLVERLALSPEQIEQLETLQQEVRTRLDQILTTEQQTQLREMAARGLQRPGEGRGPGEGRRPGAFGGRGGDRGPAAESGRRGGDRDGAAEGGRRRGAEGERRAPREQRGEPDA